MDKNQNFDALFGPATSLVWSPTGTHLPGELQQRDANPTLADQYLYCNVGRACCWATWTASSRRPDSLFTLEAFQ